MLAISLPKTVIHASHKSLLPKTYFAVQTRRAELVQKRLLEYERVQARAKLAETEKRLSGGCIKEGWTAKALPSFAH